MTLNPHRWGASEETTLSTALHSICTDLEMMGVELRPQSDFWALRDLVKEFVRNDPLCGAKLAPMYDLRQAKVSPMNAFWLLGVDAKSNEPICTIASKVYDWSDTNALLEIESGRAFSDLPDLAADIRCAVPESASRVTGICAHDGAMFVVRSRRGPQSPGGGKLSHYLSRAVRFLGLLRFPAIEWHWSLQDRSLIEAGIAREAGYPSHDKGTVIQWPGLPARRGHFVALSRAETLADAERVAVEPKQAAGKHT